MRIPLSGLVLSLIAGATLAQPPSLVKLAPAGKARTFSDVGTVSAVFEPAQAKPGQVVTLKLTVTPKERNWTYPADPPEGQLSRNLIEFPPPGDVVFVGKLIDPEGWKTKKDEANPLKKIRYYGEPTTWVLTAVVSPKATAGKKTITLKGTQVQVCIPQGNCFTTDLNEPPTAELVVLDGPPMPVPSEYAAEVQAAAGTSKTTPPPSEPPSRGTPAPTAPTAKSAEAATGIIPKSALTPDAYRERLSELRSKIITTTTDAPQRDLRGLLLAAAFWGFVSLVTPCVFPMIPITVSLFLKQGHQNPRQVLKLAAVYCLTIVTVLGASAVFLLSVFRALSVDPYMNLLLGGLFIAFALSLFGMYDLTLPGFLLRFTERRRGAGGMFGTVFGAIAFTIVSFTCVAPFLGGFAGMAASGQYSNFELMLAGIVFASAFATPFFILALFPSLLKKLPKSGGWLESIKVVMGFLELAAAFKFFRTAELTLLDRPQYFTFDLVLAAWIAIGLAAALYLFNLYRLPHDDEQANVGVIRLLIGVAFLGFSVYMVPALFKIGHGESNRPAGVIYAWVNAFLLPEPSEAGGEGLPWSADLPGSVDRITKEKRAGTPPSKSRIFVDFTGVTCTNCKYNEETVFPRPKVKELLGQFTLVQMYTDEVPVAFFKEPPVRTDRRLEASANLRFQVDLFGTQQLPLYAILEPMTTGEVKVIGVYEEGKINDPEAFVNFLEQGLPKSK